MRATEARQNSIENDLDSMSGAETTKPPKQEAKQNPEHKTGEAAQTQERKDEKQERYDNNLESAGRNEEIHHPHGEEAPDGPPPGDGGENPEKLRSRFSRENFKEEDSFDYRSKTEHPELNDLKNKCTYDVQPMGTPDSQVDRKPKAEYTSEELAYLKDVRDGVDAPTRNTTMQKVICPDSGNIREDLKDYLSPTTREGKPTQAQVFGCVAKAEDATPYTDTPQKCHDNLRLDYKETPYKNPEQSVYVIRFTDGENYNTPYNKEFGGNNEFSQPCTGNGFTASKDVSIPEYEVRKENGKGAVVTDGEIYRVNPDGSEELVAYYDKDDAKFYLKEDKG